MKKQFLLQLVSLMIISAALINCSSEEGSLNITAVTISTENTTVLLTQTATFTATNQDGIDITDLVTFFVDNVDITGNTHTPSAVGSIAVGASYEALASNFVVVNVIENITSITLAADKTSIKPVLSNKTTISAINQNGDDITSVVEIYKDGTRYFETTFSVDDFGSFVFSAKYIDIESNAVTVTSELNPTTLVLTSNRTVIPANGGTSPTFYVVDEDGDTVTPFVAIFHGSTELSNQEFNTSSIGSYDIVAKYQNVESNTVTITSEAPRSNRKILIEEFTGEWCGWCTQAAYNLDELVKANSKVLTVGIHNGDALAYSNEGLLRGSFGLGYFPSGLVGRINLGDQVAFNDTPTMGSGVLNEVDRQLNNEEILGGLSINSSVNGNTALVDVSVEFYDDIDEQVGVTIYLIENGVVSGTQQNYFSGYAPAAGSYYYDQPATLPGYEHQYVLRKVATDINGEEVPAAEAAASNTYSLSQKSIDITGYNSTNCYVIAFAHFLLDGERKTIINAQQVQLGSNIGFEE